MVTVLVGALVVPAPASAQTSAAVRVEPACGPVSSSPISIDIVGSGWTADKNVEIQFDGQIVHQLYPVQSDGSFTFTLTFTPSDSRYYEVYVRGTASSTERYSNFSAPCRSARLGITPSCSDANRDAEVTVEGFDFPASWDIRVTWDEGGPTEREDGTGTDDSGYFIHTFTGLDLTEERTYVVFADVYEHYGIVRRARYRVPCTPTTTTSSTTTSSTTTTEPTPTTATTTTTTTIPPPTPGAALVVEPPLGPPGFVTSARGTGFAPGPVTLVWSPGIGTTAAVAGEDGTFAVPVLILPNDVLGPRTLVAAGQVSTASASFLVVPDSMKPAGRDVAQIARTRRYLHR